MQQLLRGLGFVRQPYSQFVKRVRVYTTTYVHSWHLPSHPKLQGTVATQRLFPPVLPHVHISEGQKINYGNPGSGRVVAILRDLLPRQPFNF